MAQKYLHWIPQVLAALDGPSTEVALGVILYLVIDTLDIEMSKVMGDLGLLWLANINGDYTCTDLLSCSSRLPNIH